MYCWPFHSRYKARNGLAQGEPYNKIVVAGAMILLLVIIFGFFTIVLAQGGSGRVVAMYYEEEPEKIEPYLVLVTGGHEPLDNSYEVFSSFLFRYGGGVGLRYSWFGGELLYRTGRVDQLLTISDYQRELSLSSTELQLRAFVIPQWGEYRFPMGVGFGLSSMTVDRGYAGIFDRFSGNGVYFAPFVSVEYPVLNSISICVEAEYALSNNIFSDNDAWDSQHAGSLHGLFTGDEFRFWDSVGGSDQQEFNAGGFVFTLRAVINLPTFRMPEQDED